VSPARIRRAVTLAVAAIAVSVALAACGGGGGDATLGPDDEVAIQIGAQKITNGDIERRAMFLATSPNATTGAAAEPPAKDSAEFRELRRQAADQLLDERVFGLLAASCGKPCAVPAKEIDEQVQELIDQEFRGVEADLDETLAARGITREDYRASLRALQQEQLLTARVEAAVRYGDAEARAYYQKNREQYRLQAEKRLSHILVATKAQADAVRAEATADNFADVARERSIDPAAKESGGDLGAVTGGGLLPEVAAAAQTLKPGQVSAPVQSQFGWHVLLVRDLPARTKTFEEVRQEIISQQIQVARATAVQRWRDGVFATRRNAAKYLNDKVAPDPPATTTAAATTTARTTTGARTATTSTGAATP
jgi:parvulin-like peptidyl-prolyl isomerase